MSSLFIITISIIIFILKIQGYVSYVNKKLLR